MNKTRIAVLSMALLSLAASSAIAKDKDDHRCHGDSRHCWSAPEIDPGEAIAGLTLLSGTVAIIRGYRRRKK